MFNFRDSLKLDARREGAKIFGSLILGLAIPIFMDALAGGLAAEDTNRIIVSVILMLVGIVTTIWGLLL